MKATIEKSIIPLEIKIKNLFLEIKKLKIELSEYYKNKNISKKKNIKEKEKKLIFYKKLLRYYNFINTVNINSYKKVFVTNEILEEIKGNKDKINLKGVIDFLFKTNKYKKCVFVYKIPITLKESNVEDESKCMVKTKIYSFYLTKYSVPEYEFMKYLNFGTKYMLEAKKQEGKDFEIYLK